MKLSKQELKNILNMKWEERRKKLAKRKLDNNQACRDWHRFAVKPSKQGT